MIVVGGGHAGTEAALAAARMGVQTLLLTHNIETWGRCRVIRRSAVSAKGHLVKEVDALGGQWRWRPISAASSFAPSNSEQGPAVRATRAQADRVLYKAAIRSMLENQPNLTCFRAAVDDISVSGDRVTGVVTQLGYALRRQPC